MSFDLENVGIGWMIVSGVFVASFLMQMYFYLFFFRRLSIHRSSDAITSSGEPLTVIICARDEAGNLEENLPVILEQDYRNFEVVVVNDSSEDNTEEVLNRLKERYSNLRSTHIKKDLKFRTGKKLALTIGLKAANYEWVLLTDADCCPASPHWISQMQKHFIPPYEVVLGYGGYKSGMGLLNKLVRYDTFFIAMQYISFALAGLPYMGVGRNLAYKRSLFFANKGFASHLALESGDDDLFINEVAKKGNTNIEISHQSHTLSSPPEGWTDWFNQKKRHLTTGFHYRSSTRWLLGLETGSRVLFYLLFVLLLINQVLIPYVITFFIVRLIITFLILNAGMSRLSENNLLLFSPLFDIFVPLINIFCVVGNSITQKRIKWR